MGNSVGKIVVDGAMNSVGLGDSDSSGGGGGVGENSVVDGLSEAAEGIYNGVTTGTKQGMTQYKLAKSRNVAEDLKNKYNRNVQVTRQIDETKCQDNRQKAKKTAEDIKSKYNK